MITDITSPAADEARGAGDGHHLGGPVGPHDRLTSFQEQGEPDLLSQAVAQVRPYLRRDLPLAARLKAFWAGVAAAADLATTDQVVGDFIELAQQCGLIAELGKHADEDLDHLIGWALKGRNPFVGRSA
jgi:hypothetical protein